MTNVWRTLIATALALLLILPIFFGTASASSHNASHSGHGAAASAKGKLQDGVLAFRVEVSEHGLQPSLIRVRQGDRVAITFVYAEDDPSFDNPHLIEIGTYGLRTPELSPSNPEATITFTATEPGEFSIQCVLQCIGHKALVGRIEIDGGSTQTKTQLTLGAAAADGGVLLTAVVTDAAGLPLAGVPISFYVDTEFFVAGAARIGSARTNAQGSAVYTWRPVKAEAARLTARLAGTAALVGSSAATTLSVPTRSITVYKQESTKLGFPVGPQAIWLVLLCVWSTYGFVVYQASHIPAAGRSFVQPALPGVPSPRIAVAGRMGPGAWLRWILIPLAALTLLTLGTTYLSGRQLTTQASGPAAGETPAPTASQPVPPTQVVKRIELKGYHFGWDPGEIVVKKGDLVQLVVTNVAERRTEGLSWQPRNDAELVHGFSLDDYKVSVELEPGETKVVEFVADKVGRFPFECHVSCGIGRLNGQRLGHADMIGVLVVEEG